MGEVCWSCDVSMKHVTGFSKPDTTHLGILSLADNLGYDAIESLQFADGLGSLVEGGGVLVQVEVLREEAREEVL